MASYGVKKSLFSNLTGSLLYKSIVYEQGLIECVSAHIGLPEVQNAAFGEHNFKIELTEEMWHHTSFAHLKN